MRVLEADEVDEGGPRRVRQPADAQPGEAAAIPAKRVG
jgi:hypothetical protein